MAILQPQSTDKLNSPDHALSHRVFANDEAAPAQAIVVDSQGRVGIGTTGPGAKLHVVGTDFPLATFERTNTATDHFKAVNRLLHTTTADMTTTFGAQQTFSIQDSAGVINDIGAFGYQMDGADNSGKLIVQTYNSGTPQNSMVLQSDGSFGMGQSITDVNTLAGARLVMDSSGNVGIGVTNPLAKLHIDQAVADATIPVLTLDQADESEGFINFIGSDRGVIAGATASAVSVRVELGGVVYRLALYADA